MIQVGRAGAARTVGGAAWDEARRRFQEQHHVRLRGFLEPALLREVQEALRGARFVAKSHGEIAEELACFDSPAGDALLFLLNDPRLFQWVSELTGKGPIGCFVGRLYRMVPGSHHALWHSDVGSERLAALTVNVGDALHRGGELVLREAGRAETEQRIDNPAPGDAVLFRVDPALEHQVTDVEPGPPKTAWAGWFRSGPAFMDVLSGKVKL